MADRRAARPFRVLVADPPWSFLDKLPGKGRGAARNYKCLTMLQLRHYVLPPLDDDCVLFLWRVAALQIEAIDLVQAWGFLPKTELVWRKLTATGKEHFGMGRTLRAAHETCVIATRGRPQRLRADVRSILSAPVPRVEGKLVHSAKPDAFYALVHSLFAGPRASIFERKQRDGFVCFGDQLDTTEGGHIARAEGRAVAS